MFVPKNMIAYGGSFFKSIGEALIRADMENANKLYSVFSKEFDKYRNF